MEFPIKLPNLAAIFLTTFRIFSCLFTLSVAILGAFGQTPSAVKPIRQETLLNGLRVAVFPSKSGKITLKLRINAGAAFDLRGKEGTMAILSGTFFPNPGAVDFFREDLGGNLDISTTYDFIQITASSRPDEFLTLVESVANSVANPTIDKQTVAQLKQSQILRIADAEKNPAYLGERIISARLFGEFPYGRPVLGTADSVQKLDFADIIEARQRFLTADRAILAISGPVDANLALRAVRRYFGAWAKSDRQIPVTFRQPDPPASDVLSVDAVEPGIWIAFRGVSRGSSEFVAAEVLAAVLSERLGRNLPTGSESTAVYNRAYILPGAIIVKLPDDKADAREFIRSLLANPISQSELDMAKSRVAAAMSSAGSDDLWLDAATYNTTVSLPAAIAAVSLPSLQSLATKLASEPMAAVRLTKNLKSSDLQ